MVMATKKNTTPKLYDVQDAAKFLGVSRERIQQLVSKHGIGQLIGNTRVLTSEELQKLKAIPRTIGRPRKTA